MSNVHPIRNAPRLAYFGHMDDHSLANEVLIDSTASARETALAERVLGLEDRAEELAEDIWGDRNSGADGDASDLLNTIDEHKTTIEDLELRIDRLRIETVESTEEIHRLNDVIRGLREDLENARTGNDLA